MKVCGRWCHLTMPKMMMMMMQNNGHLSKAGIARDAKGNNGSAANLFSLKIWILSIPVCVYLFMNDKNPTNDICLQHQPSEPEDKTRHCDLVWARNLKFTFHFPNLQRRTFREHYKSVDDKQPAQGEEVAKPRKAFRPNCWTCSLGCRTNHTRPGSWKWQPQRWWWWWWLRW